ncbi:MAG: flagellar basal-body rod protein FlgG [Hyphomicrobium aestuarii]|nr:flagellar basal-body rod protein FlgG [Hyphomicrobium aestuarii]
MRALAIAATGMAAQQLNVEVISNNVANINTTSFKRSRAEFTDLLYQIDRAAGTPTAGTDEVIPEGLRVGLGTKAAAVRNLHMQGALAQTGNSLDLALTGKGFFRVAGPDGETLYTRAGAFNKSATGQIVTTEGYVVQPAITIPIEVTNVTVNDTGQVFGQAVGDVQPQLLGQISVAGFVNDVGLSPLSGNLYRETAASGPAVVGTAGAAGLGTIKQGYLEASNVDAVKEITELISAQRAYEMNSKVVQAADEMMGTVSKGLR